MKRPCSRRCRTSDRVLVIRTDSTGDHSTYRLHLVRSPLDDRAPLNFDPQLAEIDFSFKVECPSDFDCAPVHACPPEPHHAPDINYLAKDYASFRRLMLDRMAQLLPDWTERNAADIGVTLVELLAYVGDHLSYHQDAVGDRGLPRHRAAARSRCAGTRRWSTTPCTTAATPARGCNVQVEPWRHCCSRPATASS